jgi:hypothetical protein
MATREQVYEGIRRADAAGDSASVRRLGEYLNSMPTESPASMPADGGDSPGYLSSLGAGAGAEFGSLVLGGQKLLGKGINTVDEMVNGKSLSSLVTDKPTTMLGRAGNWLIDDAVQGQANLKTQNAPYAEANPITNKVGQVGADVIATAPVGGLLARGARVVAPSAAATQHGANLLRAVETSGAQGGNLLARSTGAAITGGASAAVVDPESAWAGTVIGGLTPGFFRLAGMTGDAMGALVRPFFARGQQRIVADILRQHVNDPREAVAALRQANELVPGSAPITAAVVGDPRLSGLTRTMQNASPDFAADVANRSASQNLARTNALQGIAGNQGKIDVAKATRDLVTAPIRENALQRAGSINSLPILSELDRLIADPKNAGQTAQAALRRMRDQVSKSTTKGSIDSRALYEIRKDAGLAMNGKLQGDASNLRYARGVLDNVQGIFADAIERAAARPAATNAIQSSAGTPAQSWSSYLSKYADMSVPIDQMKSLQDILRRAQTGTTDSQGNLVLSAAKLNSILKSEGVDLVKRLSKDQMQILRNVSADLNAAQLGLNAGKATGSNTVQNLAGDEMLSNALGKYGRTAAAKSTVGNLLKVPYLRANQDIQNLLGNALMNPNEAAALIDRASVPNPLAVLRPGAQPLAYRVPSLLSANDR